MSLVVDLLHEARPLTTPRSEVMAPIYEQIRKLLPEFKEQGVTEADFKPLDRFAVQDESLNTSLTPDEFVESLASNKKHDACLAYVLYELKAVDGDVTFENPKPVKVILRLERMYFLMAGSKLTELTRRQAVNMVLNEPNTFHTRDVPAGAKYLAWAIIGPLGGWKTVYP